MAYFITTLVLSLLSVINATNYNRQCLLHNGRCVVVCPRNMHPYNTRCDGETMSQPSCSSPVQYVIGYTCGWSRCDCDGNLLWDEHNGYCVTRGECPEFVKSSSKRKGRRRSERRKDGPKKHRKSKRVEIREEPEPFP